MSVFRTYFFDRETGKELSDHPLNGKTWIGISGYAHRNGKFVEGTCTSVTIADYADLHRINGEKRVTADDFDRPVRVKVWGPNGTIDFRDLVRD